MDWHQVHSRDALFDSFPQSFKYHVALGSRGPSSKATPWDVLRHQLGADACLVALADLGQEVGRFHQVRNIGFPISAAGGRSFLFICGMDGCCRFRLISIDRVVNSFSLVPVSGWLHSVFHDSVCEKFIKILNFAQNDHSIPLFRLGLSWSTSRPKPAGRTGLAGARSHTRQSGSVQTTPWWSGDGAEFDLAEFGEIDLRGANTSQLPTSLGGGGVGCHVGCMCSSTK